jgi:hypothetical protein
MVRQPMNSDYLTFYFGLTPIEPAPPGLLFVNYYFFLCSHIHRQPPTVYFLDVQQCLCIYMHILFLLTQQPKSVHEP